MKKFKVTRVRAYRDAYANYPYKTCDICKVDIVTEQDSFRVDNVKSRKDMEFYAPVATTCSEACASTYVLQHMDDKDYNYRIDAYGRSVIEEV